MTTRDPSSGAGPDPLPNPTSPGEDIVREPTESLHFGPDLDPDLGPGVGHSANVGHDRSPGLDMQAAAVLALGTHDRAIARPSGRPHTAIESPGARGKTPPPPRPRRADEPADYLGSVLGSYRVVELLGKGGMGYVYRAEHIKLGREVALKLLRSDYASRRDAVTRFFQEARTVNRVRHRNIVDVTDFVELDDGTTYIVMELLTGTSLGAWAQDGVDLARAIAVLVQICDGLGAAHQVGVVHRDLKPDNVVVVPTPDGGELAKLLDFGVAKLLNRDDEDVGFQTAAGSVIGTPAYMSPEQAGGMVIDARSDIYSLGAIMYELFTGQPMFRGRSFGEYVRKHLTEMPVPPHETPGGATIDPRIEALILRCIDKDPDQRFAHISELREALLHLLSECDAAAGLYPPSTGSISSSGPRALRTPLPPIASVLPLPPPISQSSPGVPDPAGAAPHSSGPHAPHSPGPHRAHLVDASGMPASGPPPIDPHAATASSPLDASVAGPHAVTPHSSGPHRAHRPDTYPSSAPPSGSLAAGPHTSRSPDTGSHASGPPPAQASAPYPSGAQRPGPPMTLEGSYSLPPPMTLEGSYQLPVPPPPSATPWWLWFSGGALAVGVGIATALWVAGRNSSESSSRGALISRPATPTTSGAPTSSGAPTPSGAAATPPPPATATGSTASATSAASASTTGGAAAAAAASAGDGATTADSTAPSTPPVHPPLIEVRFDSTPSASVFADGQSTELCRTPCAFDIDPVDGGPTDQRGFVVRRAGYLDRTVTVDLAGTEREFRVTLQHAEPSAHPRDARADGKDGADRHIGKRTTRPAKKPGRGDAPEPRPDPAAEPGPPGDARPAKKPAPPIDPTDTLDPFRKK